MRDRNKTKPWRQPHHIARQRKTGLTECVRAKTKLKRLAMFKKETYQQQNSSQRLIKFVHSAFVVYVDVMLLTFATSG
jgi:hypothetical protein